MAGLTACGKRKEVGMQSREQALYQCPMHPEIIRKEPGTCPICHMQLQKMETESTTHEHHEETGRASFTLSPQRQQLIGVTFGAVEFRDLERVIRASGRIAYDPELYSAIEEYHQALSGGPELESIRKSTRMKLRLLGLSDAQIDDLANKPRNAAVGLVLGRAGGTVWVYADVYEYEVNFIKPGQTMEIASPALPGETFTGKVLSVDPVISAMTRTARVRAEVNNPKGKFRPEMYLDVKIRVPLGKKLAVPGEAVLDTGERKVVFAVHEDNTFEPREVRLGVEAEGFYAVLFGLEIGDRVVTSANFLIDSESQFKAAIEAFRKRDGGEGMPPGHQH